MTGKTLLREWIRLEVSPKMLKESRDANGGRLIIPAILQHAGMKNQNKRVYPREILQREMENYQKSIRENRATGELDHPECVGRGFHALLSRGWTPMEEIVEGDLAATLDHDSGRISYQSIQRVIDEPYCGKMVEIKNKSGTIDQLVTPNHRVLLWDRYGKPYFELASDLHEKNLKEDGRLSHSAMRRAGLWEGNDPDIVTLPGTDRIVSAEDWMAFLGIWLAEGFADGTVRGHKISNGVAICQKKEDVRDEIRNLLLRIGVPYHEHPARFTMYLGADFHRFFFDIGNSHTKYVPNEVKALSPRLLSILLEWMLKGDGKNRIGYKKIGDLQAPIVKEYATVSPRLADDVQEIMIKLGYGATIHRYEPEGDRKAPDFDETGRMILEESRSPINIVYGHASRSMSMDSRFLKTSLVDYDDRVYCLTVPNGTWMARSPSGKTFWTGNSSVVSLERVSHIVREAWWDGDVVKGKIEVLTTQPMGKILEGLLDSGVAIGISSRGVGSTEKTNEGVDQVQEDYQLICYDAVSEPSTPGAYLFAEGKKLELDPRKIFSKADRINRVLNEIVRK